MKKLIAIVLCFVFAAVIFSGCRGSVRDQNMQDRYTEPTTGVTVPSMPSEPTVPSEPSMPSEPTIPSEDATTASVPADGYSEPTLESGVPNEDGMDRAMPRSRG